jgi:peptidoglycan/xylan/chitin deacetylase (PgdA/CDA1 family)
MKLLATKRSIRYIVALGAYYSGLNELYVRLRRLRKGAHALILAYHSVREDLDYCEMFVTPELLHAQVSALQSRYRFVTVEQLVNRLGAGRLTEDVAVVTFDDGYRDNLTSAAKILNALNVPFTLFLASRHIDTGEPTLFLAITLIIDRAGRDVLHLPGRGLRPLPLKTRTDREAAIRVIDALGKPLDWDDRRHLVRELAAALEVDIGNGLLDGQMLDWGDVRALARLGAEIGAHSVSHAVLSRLDQGSARTEIQGSVDRVAEELNARCRVFAYPYGGPEECGPREAAVCRELGLVAAVTLQETDPTRGSVYTLGRVMPTRDRVIGPSGRFSAALYACETSGLMSGLLRLVRAPLTTLRPSNPDELH